MSRWLLPVPESPIRQSGSPLRIHSPLASPCTVAGLIASLASKSKSPSHLSRGNPAALTRRMLERRSRSSTSAISSSARNPWSVNCSLFATVSASSTTARIVGSRSRRQAWSTAVTAASSVNPRRRRRVGVIDVVRAVGAISWCSLSHRVRGCCVEEAVRRRRRPTAAAWYRVAGRRSPQPGQSAGAG